MKREITTKDNLCDTCKLSYPSCPADETDIEFGDGIGEDNVIDCTYYDEDLTANAEKGYL